MHSTTKSVDSRSGFAGSLRRLIGGASLDESEARGLAREIMDGHLSPTRIGALLIALRMKGETVDEIEGFVRAMRERSTPLPVAGDDVIDTCGTGGDGAGTFNISTAVALVAAGAGCRVAKHGNRAVSSRCGSADVLEALGVATDLPPSEAANCLETAGICFLFAPHYHPAAKHAAVPRREIGVRSIFNVIGPLTHPAGARRQLMGVFDGELTAPLAQVLGRLGSTRCLVVHGEDGLDEITLTAATRVAELREGQVSTYRITPEQFGMDRCAPEALAGGAPDCNAAIIEEILDGADGAPREIVTLNAAAAIYVAGRADDLAAGVAAARESLDSGMARGCLDALRRVSRNRDDV